MLTKQWQMGEFRGSDAGSPVFAKVLLQTTRLTKYQPAGGKPELFDSAVPLETKVERRPMPLHRQKRILSLDLRLVMARQWFALIADSPTTATTSSRRYPIAKPDPTQSANVDVCAHPEAWDTFQALAGPRHGWRRAATSTCCRSWRTRLRRRGGHRRWRPRRARRSGTRNFWLGRALPHPTARRRQRLGAREAGISVRHLSSRCRTAPRKFTSQKSITRAVSTGTASIEDESITALDPVSPARR